MRFFRLINILDNSPSKQENDQTNQHNNQNPIITGFGRLFIL